MSTSSTLSVPSRHTEFALLALALLAFNLPLFGIDATSQHLDLAAVRDGEWWRLFTHPLVHVTRYHLLIDGVAFAWLFSMLPQSRRDRWRVIGACWLGSLVGVLVWSPQVEALGFGGLSGLSHGLAVWVGLEAARESRRSLTRCVGGVFAVGVVAKSLFELSTGQPLFEGSHLGDVGTPLVGSHLGGAILGALVFGLRRQNGPESGARSTRNSHNSSDTSRTASSRDGIRTTRSSPAPEAGT